MITWPNIRLLPPSQLLFMASLDVIQFSGLVVSSSGITPTMTLILLHTSTPLFVVGSKFLFPMQKYSLDQIIGNCLIILSILVSLLQPIIAQYFGHAHYNLVLSSVVYTISAGFQGYAMAYKEYSIPSWSVPPLDIHYLSFCLFLLQSILTIIISPIIYSLQGMSNGSLFYCMFQPC